jgi:hypothetical protein
MVVDWHRSLLRGCHAFGEFAPTKAPTSVLLCESHEEGRPTNGLKPSLRSMDIFRHIRLLGLSTPGNTA